MWRSLGLTLLAGLLVVCRGESETGGVRCKPAVEWKAARLEELRQKLENSGFVNITYVVVNSRDENSQRLHFLLEKKLSDNITLYRQNPEDPDVWSAANAEKDDFQIYDRCGRLTHHLSLPYTILSQPHVEEAIRNTYCTAMCGDCELEHSDQLEACNRTKEAKTEEEILKEQEGDHHHHQEGQHHHHHHHHHHHGHHHHEGGERQGHGGSNHQQVEGQDILGQRGFLEGQVQRRQFDLGQAHVGQFDLGQAHVGQFDLGQAHEGQFGKQQVMRRP